MLHTLTLSDQPATHISPLSATAVCLVFKLALMVCSLLSSIFRPLLSSLSSLSSLSLLYFSLHSTHFTGSFLQPHSLCISPLSALFWLVLSFFSLPYWVLSPPHVPTFISKLFPSAAKLLVTREDLSNLSLITFSSLSIIQGRC